MRTDMVVHQASRRFRISEPRIPETQTGRRSPTRAFGIRDFGMKTNSFDYLGHKGPQCPVQ